MNTDAAHSLLFLQDEIHCQKVGFTIQVHPKCIGFKGII